jgi:hypothetical protein
MMEKRKHKRYPQTVPIIYNAVKPRNYSFSGGEMKNYSKDGLCFLTGHSLDPGSSVTIVWTDMTDLPDGLFKKEVYLLKKGDNKDYLACRCEVIYSREISGNTAFDYENGVRFLEMDIKLP